MGSAVDQFSVFFCSFFLKKKHGLKTLDFSYRSFQFLGGETHRWNKYFSFWQLLISVKNFLPNFAKLGDNRH